MSQNVNIINCHCMNVSKHVSLIYLVLYKIYFNINAK